MNRCYILNKGFTVLELMVVVAISSVLAITTIPVVIDLVAVFDRYDAQSILNQDILRVRSESVTRGCRGIIKISADGKSYNFGCDYLSYDTTSPAEADTIFFVRNLPRNITMSASSDIIFNSRGNVIDVSGALTSPTISLVQSKGAVQNNFTVATLLPTGSANFS